ncbi:hypothetical protein [Methylobacterium longum]|uniref:Uncharacterized protein n=1 Tax=Methylobacterium longum TaxID=767694 RepID=A0ABT8AVK7_9HYPH|nr:hypothetical protein [Methylobacterium longum]MDN3573921.1 hypothetical protein [Methylobacterium longum]GJE13596.1 hypothetical protein FOHLNKBM_4660 [Methylobacterium longum]
MTVTRQQAIQLVYALLYGASDTAHLRLDKPIPPRLIASVRRLLDEDVTRARASQDLQPEAALAFYDELPAGTGHDVQYTPLRVFNLAVAHELARFGCKQGEVVELISEFQKDLKTAFDRANAGLQTWGRTKLTQSSVSHSTLSLREKREQTKIFLAVRRVEATESAVAFFGGELKAGERLCHKQVLYGRASLDAFLSEELVDGLFGAFIIELSELAVRVTELAQRAPPRKRGRRSSKPPSNWSDAVAQFHVQERDHDK